MNRLYIVMYHYTRDLAHSRYPRIKGLDIKMFRKQIEFFKNNFSVVTMEEVIAASKGQVVLPENALLCTFDDGYVDNYTYALPILEEEKVLSELWIFRKKPGTYVSVFLRTCTSYFWVFMV